MAEANEQDFYDKIFPVPERVREKSYIKSREEYEKLYKESIENPDAFWAKMATERLAWFKPFDKNKVSSWSFDAKDLHVRWFEGGKLNVSYNCLDRHLETKKNKAAVIFEGNNPNDWKVYTYFDMYREVNKFANVLKSLGIKKGDRVSIYLPMIAEALVVMLACARIGAIHSLVFGGFSAEALRDRINDCEAKILVTCDGTYRGAKAVPQKANADKALEQSPSVKTQIVVKRTGMEVPMKEGRDVWYEDLMAKADRYCKPEEMDAEDPLFILYTSGSTGQPKGVVHTQAGYLLYASMTQQLAFDVRDEDVYWCTADIGWVTGHSYVVYGPLCNGFTTIVFEGVPNYPNFDRFWAVIEKYNVNNFYTAPTAIRSIAKEGDKWVDMHDLSSLRVLGSVGEPLNPEAWWWFWKKVGGGRCTIADTWWQTENGGHMILPLPGAIDIKPAKAMKPFFGVVPALMDENGKEIVGPGKGSLCIKKAWPGITRGLWNDKDGRFIENYFSQFPGYYFSGDGAERDADGDYKITGRVDDVINVSGHRMGTAEVEAALTSHPDVAESAVVGFPHDIKGQGIFAYVTLNNNVAKTDELKKALIAHVRKEIGPIATPDVIQWADGLPKTRSGKIMRRVLRNVAAKEYGNFGDTSTLADPAVVDDLVTNRKKLG
ncbi:MAG TPA: acetate--CoA ligase [Smithellaceae bacterium]|jgi:acetyl-CoA synthetase|nr:acetate--CoA ligase [Smithellaceae bacterium]HOF76736.1 acetate--CoA ligase [Smithellaceae bacterium]HOS08947.1 acetate--CoA ligase [Smithellaceae bacterium]HOU03911.1 acetate--CoA ligase [Smithellaceae bacterium]HPD49479.1 acetate--CoA ligase [Smithellaceae bacterium]